MATLGRMTDLHDLDPVSLSAAALRAARASAGEAEFRALAALSPVRLAAGLAADDTRLAFWINVYNAAIHQALRQDPGLYRRRTRFFAKSGVTVASRRLSFNAIEHGLLRRSMFGYSLGYLANPIPGRFERRFRLARRDPRVHFALNCGASSCPPIAEYGADAIDEQLDVATKAYLEAECEYDRASNTLSVPRLFLWFRGDFGGAHGGALGFLVRHGVLEEGARPRLKFRKWDWAMTLG